MVGLEAFPGKGMPQEASFRTPEGNAATFHKKWIIITTSISACICTNKVEGKRTL